jgi:hypothetical protein
MTTGRHIVRDISCRQCDQIVGWKYDKAYETQEQYKENKFILEAELLVQVCSRQETASAYAVRAAAQANPGFRR